jgi:glycosyltransferase involved in cell wall biosynthesis
MHSAAISESAKEKSAGLTDCQACVSENFSNFFGTSTRRFPKNEVRDEQINKYKQNMRAPRVSIGLPVFNGAAYLRRALDCIVQQDCTDFELIISDNASTDATQEICREVAARDRRIRYYRNETNIGASRNFNRVFELAHSEFFKWAPHDDEFHPSLIRRCLEAYERSSSATVLVFTKATIIDESGRATLLSPDTIGSSSIRPSIRLGSLMHHSVSAHPLWGVIKSDALRQTRLMGCIHADHVLLAELALVGNFVEIPEVLYQERRHAACATAINQTTRELLAWHDPAMANHRTYLPQWLEIDLEYFKSIRHILHSKVDRLICYSVVLATPFWRRFLRWTGPIRHRIGMYRNKPRPAADAGVTQADYRDS